MSELSTLLGQPVPFEFEGRAYKVGPRDIDMEAAFCLWLEREDLAVIQRHGPDLSRPDLISPVVSLSRS